MDYDNKFGIEYNGLMFYSFGISNHSMFNNPDKENLDKKKHLIKINLCKEKFMILVI